jgi:hypothetical protein
MRTGGVKLSGDEGGAEVGLASAFTAELIAAAIVKTVTIRKLLMLNLH